ncbi:MAG TPA: alkaline phosphatase, partial [Alcanivorax sp.]|nr:alkaline phosphatase [Alcanivorax sp.]
MTSTPNRARRWFERLNGSRHMLWLLAALSFLETIILPVPIELVLIPLMALNRQRLWRIATVTTAGCLAASLVGYGVGMALYQSVGTWFIDTLGMQDAYQAYQGFFD